jgi:hypothetical protein
MMDTKKEGEGKEPSGLLPSHYTRIAPRSTSYT